MGLQILQKLTMVYIHRLYEYMYVYIDIFVWAYLKASVLLQVYILVSFFLQHIKLIAVSNISRARNGLLCKDF